MQIPDDALVDDLCWPDLIEALRRQFRDGCEVPERHHHGMEVQGEAEATMLPMPAWQPGNRIGVKLVNVFPGYSQRGLPGISADYLLYDGKTGQGPTTMNGNIITGALFKLSAAARLRAATRTKQSPSSRPWALHSKTSPPPRWPMTGTSPEPERSGMVKDMHEDA